MATVTMYRDNKIDRAERLDPHELAEAFVSTLKGEIHPGYEPSGRISVEFEYRWWLSDTEIGHGWTWKDEDWPALWGALRDYMNSDEAVSAAVIDGLKS
ncbi:MAG: hypothetical protein JSS68_14965 [Actinobacteria bacterium]|nr:hypothetical protein [Actinomycetota bacterium]